MTRRVSDRRARVLWGIVAVALLVSGCAASSSGGVQLPEDFKIEAPARTVPAKRAAFSGRWQGTWDGLLEHVLIVEQITGDEAQVVYAWGPNRQWQTSPGFARFRAKFKDDSTLVVTSPRPATATYVMQPDGTLAALYQWSGGVSRASMRRTQP